MQSKEPTDRALQLRAISIPSLLTLVGLLFFLLPEGVEFSEVENRNLNSLPTFSWDRLWSGAFAQGLDLYAADHFPLREEFVTAAFWIKEHQGIQSESAVFYTVPDDEAGGLDRAHEWGKGDEEGFFEEGPFFEEGLGIAAPDEKESVGSKGAAAERREERSEGESTGGVPLPAQEPKKRKKRKKRKIKQPKVHNGVLVYGKEARALQLFGGRAKHGVLYAKVINRYREALDEKLKIYSTIVPTAVSFYLPEEHQYKTRSEKEFIEAVHKAHSPGISTMDVYGQLEAHKEEFIYFRTDHHWTGRGAYYAYRAFCEAAKIEAIPLEKMERKEKKRFVGSMYGYTKAPELRKKPEYLEYFIPPVEYSALRYTKGNLKKGKKAWFILERSRGYGVFLGGDYPLMIAETSIKNGKVALFVKNSFGNAFAPYLLSHFQKVLVVDYRYFSGKLLKLIEKHKVSDLIFMNVSLTSGSKYHRRRIKRIMGRPKRKRVEKKGKKREGSKPKP